MLHHHFNYRVAAVKLWNPYASMEIEDILFVQVLN